MPADDFTHPVRRADGSIDHDYYREKARAMRSQEMSAGFSRALAELVRTIPASERCPARPAPRAQPEGGAFRAVARGLAALAARARGRPGVPGPRHTRYPDLRKR